MAQKLESGVNVFDYATDRNIDIYNGTFGQTDGTNPSSMEVINDFMMNKITINGVKDSKQNVNFIRNDVVQDGLIKSSISQTNIRQDVTVPTDICTVILNMNMPTINSSEIIRGSGICWSLVYYTSGIALRTGTTTIKTIVGSDKLKPNNEIIIIQNGNGLFVSVNGINDYVYDTRFTGNTTVTINGYNQQFVNKYLVYNRSLTTQEIAHNFSVLNNSPSINFINDYAISTDTDHIQDRTGRTTEEINRVFYKQNCKEFTSNGADISVNNGMDGYVLSGKLEGQTVKNHIKNKKTFNTDNGRASNWNELVNLKPNTQYTITTNLIKTEASGFTKLQFKCIDDSKEYLTLNEKNIGINNTVFTPTKEIKEIELVYISQGDYDSGTRKLVEIWSLCEGNLVINGNIPFGLSSTQAVVSNLGLKYSFYCLTDDRLNNKVIELGGVSSDVKDTLEIKEDGGGIYTQNTINLTLDDTLSWSYNNLTDNLVVMWNTSFKVGYGSSNIIGDILNYSSLDIPKIYLHPNTNGRVYLGLRKSDIGYTDDIGTSSTALTTLFKNYLKINPVKCLAKIDNPIITTIPKELVPTILTQLQNEFTFGDAVAPSKVTIQAPVNRIAEMQAELDEIKALIQTPSNMNLTMNYIEDEYNKNQNAEGEM